MKHRTHSAHKVPTTLYLFEHEVHGIGMEANHPWSRRLLDWLDRL
ncbi:MAG: hypothetical protein ACLFVC_07430 [Opitutales bacterium]